MLKKFIAIKNVGKFRNCAAAGDIEFRKLSLIYAENGRGKTTLSAILRSLESGDPLFIAERRTVDGGGNPHVDILSAGGTLTFAGNSWTAKYENLVVFDSTYVTENVYSGDSVEHDHKKRLYQVSIGKQGVELAKKVTDLDAKSRELAAKLTGSVKILSKNVPDGMTLEQFLALAKDDDIESKIANQKKSVEALADAEAIKAKSAFTKLTTPILPDGLSEMLAKVLDGISKDAEAKIQKHITEHKMSAKGQSWLSEGLPYVHNDACPFCGLNVSENDLLQAYRSYFSEAYGSFKDAIKTFESNFSTAFSEKKTAALNTTLVQNQANLEFWKKYAAVSLPEISFDEKIAPVVQTVIDTIAPLIQKKISAPLDSITFSPEAQKAVEALVALKPQIDDYNKAVDTANPAIAAVKKSVETGNSAALRKELARLEAQKKRHSDELSPACTEHANTQTEKTQTETDKGNTKKALDEYTEAVLQKYEEGINKLLDRFGASFRITGTKQQYLGGSPSSTFKLSINGVAVELGDSKTPRGTTCFRNTMSAGDRNTLALAFFLVQLQQRADLNTLTVVFDDPLTSLDRFRQQFTRDQIRAVEKKANQVIVLSHEPAFLQLIATDFDAGNLRLLFLARDGVSDTTIKPWDMKSELAPGFHKDVATLSAYYHGDAEDFRAVIRCIRPVMESYLRGSYHGQFAENEWLGSMIDKIRNAAAGQPLEAAKLIFNDLESLNDYTKRYHHDDNSVRQDSGQPQDGELQPFVKLTLQLTNRL
jgi:wobble nucleotide-excising tRNase